jgi:hypothetical protein
MTTKQEQTQAADELRDILERHHDVYAIVHHVSRSGMQRRIDFYVIEVDTESSTRQLNGREPASMHRISHLIAKVRQSRLTDDGVVINGCGMDMGWHEIYSCRYTLGLGEVHASYKDGEELHLGYGFDVRYL